MAVEASTEKNGNKSDKAFLWKYATMGAFAIAIPSSIYSMHKLYKETTVGPRILVSVQYHEFAVPPALVEELRRLDRLKDQEDHILTIGGPGPKEHRYGRLRGFISLTIRNAGNLAANDVRIQVRDDGICNFKWDDGTTQNVDFTNDVPIGTLPIEKSVQLSLWTASAPSADARPLLIVHSTGSVSVSNRPSLWVRVMAGIGLGAIGPALGVVFLAWLGRGYLIRFVGRAVSESITSRLR